MAINNGGVCRIGPLCRHDLTDNELAGLKERAKVSAHWGATTNVINVEIILRLVSELQRRRQG